jgi:hypothetical protein
VATPRNGPQLAVLAVAREIEDEDNVPFDFVGLLIDRPKAYRSMWTGLANEYLAGTAPRIVPTLEARNATMMILTPWVLAFLNDSGEPIQERFLPVTGSIHVAGAEVRRQAAGGDGTVRFRIPATARYRLELPEGREEARPQVTVDGAGFVDGGRLTAGEHVLGLPAGVDQVRILYGMRPRNPDRGSADPRQLVPPWPDRAD